MAPSTLSNHTGIELSINDTIATLTLNTPEKHNALADKQIKTINRHLNQLNANTNIRVLIVTGTGHKTFCAGASIEQMSSGHINGEKFAEMTDLLARLPIPTICALNGSAYGGGAELGLACDFRIGISNMRLFVPPAKIGLCYPVNGIQRFVSTLGINTTKRLLLAGEHFNAEQLLALGYLTHLVKPEELKIVSWQLAEQIASYAPLALKAMKRICNDAALGSLDKISANQIAQECNQSSDLLEGFEALAEKRAPIFQGK